MIKNDKPGHYMFVYNGRPSEKPAYYDPDHDFSVLIRTLRYIIAKSGYELIGRIEVRNKKTGKIYK